MRASEDVLSALRGGRRGLWERLWFGDGPLVRLAAFRIVALLTALFCLRFHRMSLVQADAESAFVTRRFVPVYFLELLGIGPMSPEVARALYVVLFALIVLGILGLWTRAVCALVAAGMLLWVGTAYSYGQPHHEYGVLAFALAALPFGPVGARLSLDSLRARWRAAARGASPERPDEGPWAMLPIRFVQLTAALGYLFAGITKLRIGGTEWMNGYTLQGIMLEFDAPLTDAVARSLPLLRAMSVGVIATQILCVLAVLWRPLRWFFVPGIVAVHLGSMVTMDTGTFLGLWAMQAAFVDLERVPGFLRRKLGAGGGWRRLVWTPLVALAVWGLVVFYVEKGPPLVPWLGLPLALAGLLGLLPSARVTFVHDGSCGICRRTAALVRALDWSGRVRHLDATAREEVERELPTLDRAASLEDVHLVDARGRVHRGFRAYRALAWRLPPILPLAPLLHLPGAAEIGERVYRHVANGRRHDVCSLDG